MGLGPEPEGLEWKFRLDDHVEQPEYVRLTPYRCIPAAFMRSVILRPSVNPVTKVSGPFGHRARFRL